MDSFLRRWQPVLLGEGWQALLEKEVSKPTLASIQGYATPAPYNLFVPNHLPSHHQALGKRSGPAAVVLDNLEALQDGQRSDDFERADAACRLR